MERPDFRYFFSDLVKLLRGRRVSAAKISRPSDSTEAACVALRDLAALSLRPCPPPASRS